MGDSDRDNLTVRTVGRIADLDAADWDACAGADNLRDYLSQYSRAPLALPAGNVCSD